MSQRRSPPPLLCRDTASRPVARCKSLGAPAPAPACLTLPTTPNRDYVITLRLNRKTDAALIDALRRKVMARVTWDNRTSLNRFIIDTLRKALQ